MHALSLFTACQGVQHASAHWLEASRDPGSNQVQRRPVRQRPTERHKRTQSPTVLLTLPPSSRAAATLHPPST